MQVIKHAYKHILVLQDSIVTYYQLLGNEPLSVVTCFSRFVSWLAFVPRDCKANHYLISLGKFILKRLHSCNRGKNRPHTRL